MARIPLIGGAYQARNLIANAQRCVNLFPETNPQDSPVPTTHYTTPGMRRLVQSTIQGEVRSLYVASNGQAYAVIGNGVFLLDAAWRLTKLGDLPTGRGKIAIKDNGFEIMLSDGSAAGFSISLQTNKFSVIQDSALVFEGATSIDEMDTYFLFNYPGTAKFGSTLSNGTQFDPLYVASKTGRPDPIQVLMVVHRELWLIGTQTSEVWVNRGGEQFPFERLDGVFLEHGTVGSEAVTYFDNSLFFICKDQQGNVIAFQTVQYQAQRISTFAIEQIWQSYATVSDVKTFVYQVAGHAMLVFTFPSADATWVYDLSTKLWHQWAWSDANGKLHRHRANCYAFAYNTHIVGDWSDGTIYALDWNVLTDAGNPIQRIRAFPHTLMGIGPQGNTIPSDGKRMQYNSFIADMGVGHMQADVTDFVVKLRWSFDRGASWGNYVEGSLGPVGNYLRSVLWRRLGIGRDVVFEISWSAPVTTALNGAWVDARVAGT